MCSGKSLRQTIPLHVVILGHDEFYGISLQKPAICVDEGVYAEGERGKCGVQQCPALPRRGYSHYDSTSVLMRRDLGWLALHFRESCFDSVQQAIFDLYCFS
jgi:hypothetical protein